MSVVSYLILFREINFDFTAMLIAELFETFSESPFNQGAFREELFGDMLKIRHCEKLENKRIFKLDLHISEENFDQTINEEQMMEFCSAFAKKVQDDKRVDCIVKFLDDFLKDKLNVLQKELFDLEMRIREILSLIFLSRYPYKPHSFLEDFNVRKDGGEEERQIKFFENELFFISFSEYTDLINKQKDITINELSEKIIENENFQELKESLLTRGITNQDHKQFMEGVKILFDSLIKIRNCVAHNRNPSETELDNFERSKKELKEKIQEFWEICQFGKDIVEEAKD